MLNFPKVTQLRQIGKKGLIKYCENAAYYNATPSLSVREGHKKRNTHVHKTSTSKQFKRN